MFRYRKWLLLLVGVLVAIHYYNWLELGFPPHERRSNFRSTPEGARRVIVFVHGVTGDSVSTWTNGNGAYWPDLVAKDPSFSDAAVFVYDYNSSFFGQSLGLIGLTDNFYQTLQHEHVLDYPEVIFVSHSLGGLVTQSFLARNEKIAKKVPLLLFYGTPSEGSYLAWLVAIISLNPQFVNLSPVRSESVLGDLMMSWRKSGFKSRSLCAFEGRPILPLITVVDFASATRSCDGGEHAILADHRGMVKPVDTKSDSYRVLANAYMLVKSKSVQVASGRICDRTQLVLRMLSDCRAKLKEGVHDPQTELLTAEALMQAFHCDEAMPVLDSYLSKVPNSLAGLAVRARCYKQLGRDTDLAAATKAVLDATPNTAEDNLAVGRLLLFLDRPRDAITRISHAISLDPESPAPYYFRSMAYSALQEHKFEIADLSEAIRIERYFPVAYLTRSRAQDKLGSTDAALLDLKTAIELFPTFIAAYTDRADLHRRMGNCVAAIADYTEGIELDAEYSRAYKARGWCHLERKDYSRAIADFSTAIKLNPRDAGAFYHRSFAHFPACNVLNILFKKCDETGRLLAIADARKALQIDPEDSDYQRRVNYLDPPTAKPKKLRQAPKPTRID